MSDESADNIPCIAQSAPDYDEERVIDLDFSFTQGNPISITLRPEKGDRYETFENRIVFFIERPGLTQPAEEVIFLHSLAFMSTRHRIRKTKKEGPPKPTQPAGPTE